MKRYGIFILFACLFMATEAPAQLSANGRHFLERQQDSLKRLTNLMINAPMADTRQDASDAFIPAFVHALKTTHSFDFAFDSLGQISMLYDKDSSFRIFTWAIALSKIQYRFYGAIQMNTKNGVLKLYPLFDNTFDTKNMDTITDNKAWIGALYYKMIRNKFQNKTFYTLLGWCGYGFQTNKKVIEILTFKNGSPVFGAPVFNFKNDSVPLEIKNRFFLEYKREGNAGLNFDTSMNMIIFDHLTSLKGDTANKATLVPDGTYEGFKWENGYWMHHPKIFHQTITKPPLPKPLKFDKKIEGVKK